MPKVDITTVALHSRGVTAGSMRGYGTLQTMTALEVLIDEAAAALRLDPIEFRRRNALKTGGRTMTGNPYIVSVRAPEILDKLEKHPIWQQRAHEKARGQRAGSSSAPASPAPPRITVAARTAAGEVEIDPQGRIAIRGDHVEMGTGIGTALANRVATYLGGVADEVAVHDVDALARSRSSPQAIPHHEPGDPGRRGQNPRWVPAISTATAASNGAHVGTHAAAEAARVVFRFGLWPAALELWGIAPTDREPSNGRRRAGRPGNCHARAGTLALPAIAARRMPATG